MFTVLVGSSTSRTSELAERELVAAGFAVQVLQLESIVAAMRGMALAGGRVDTVVLGTDQHHADGHLIAEDVAKNIRNLDETLSFRGGVRARATPIVFTDIGVPVTVLGSGQSVRSFPGGIDTALEGIRWSSYGDVDELQATVVEVITAWRQALLEELDYIGFTVALDASGRPKVSHALQRKRRESELLADQATPGALRESQYLILAEDFLQSFGVYDELRFLIENYESIARNEGIKPETVFQRFFEKHPHLVRRDLFDQHWAKPTLRIPENPRRFFQPDFVLRPHIAANVGTKWEVLDLKLPDDPLLTSGSFHPAFSQKLTKAVQQLRNYRNYFSRADTRENLVAQFGYQPLHPRISVLIGRRDRTEGLEQAQGSAALDVNIITYDEIVEFEESRLILQGHFAGLFTS